MSDDLISVEGEEETIARLVALGRLKYAKSGVKAGALYLKGKLQKYPPVNRLKRSDVYPVPWKTKKQKRFFFWALRNNIIQVPYRRGLSPKSERFKARWTLASQNDGFTQVIGNNASYGPLLMGKREEQSIFMRRVGWEPAEEIAGAERAEVFRMIRQSIADGLNE